MVSVDHFQIQALDMRGLLYSQVAENHFTSELKRHFQNLMESPENVEAYSDLVCHFDIYKSRLGNPVKPDLVLHAGQDNRRGQEIYVEVKLRYGLRQDLIDDLEKLERAISPELEFKYAVAVVVNETLQRTKDIIREFIDDRFSDRALRKLYLFHGFRKHQNGAASYTFENFLRIKNNG